MPEKKTYVVTGGNGYIGSHMCKHLVQMGHEVHIIDNLSTSGPHWNHTYGIFHPFDISDDQSVRPLLGSLKVDCVFHFAARSLVEEGQEHPFLYYRENFNKTQAFLESCVLSGVKNFIFSSTCAVFGLPQAEKMAEDHPKRPVNTYGITKKLMEEMMGDIAQKGLMNILIFRYFNACGCDPQGELGENHLPETHLIPNLCSAYLEKEQKVLEIFGQDYPTRDGTCIRDYIHVEDLVSFHYQGAKYLSDHPGQHDFNLGSEQGYSIKEVVQTFEELIGEKVPWRMAPRRRGDPHCLIGDSQKAKRVLGLECRYNLKDALLHTLNWQRDRKRRAGAGDQQRPQ